MVKYDNVEKCPHPNTRGGLIEISLDGCLRDKEGLRDILFEEDAIERPSIIKCNIKRCTYETSVRTKDGKNFKYCSILLPY